MEKYKHIEIIGRGSFGEVTKAQNIETGEIVAIKTMKQQFTSWEECINLRELKSLRKLVNNKNIVKLKEVIRVNNQLSLVFEHLDQDIFKLYEEQKKQGKKLTENQIKSIFFQIANSLSYMHKHGFFHRDLKPENILFSRKDGLIKLIDFGLAREIRSRPPYTDYVSTRWYRAPELLLHSSNYNSPVDIFALGCIICELFMLKPLFNGSSEVDQLQKMCTILGTPSKVDWPEGYKLASQKGINFPQYQPIPLSSIMNNCSSEGLQLISECLRWDPQKRPTAQKILTHPYFKDIEKLLPEDYFNENNDENKNTQNYNNILSQKRISNYQYSSSSDANINLGQKNSEENKSIQEYLTNNINNNNNENLLNQKPPLNPGKKQVQLPKQLDLLNEESILGIKNRASSLQQRNQESSYSKKRTEHNNNFNEDDDILKNYLQGGNLFGSGNKNTIENKQMEGQNLQEVLFPKKQQFVYDKTPMNQQLMSGQNSERNAQYKIYNNIYDFSNKIQSNILIQQQFSFPNSNNNNVGNNAIINNNNAIQNKNIYDFNNVKMPLRNIQIPFKI